MTTFRTTASRSAITLLLAVGVVTTTATAEDLSKYRNFQFGTALSTVVKQVGVDRARVKVIHSRPAMIQELEWSPQPLGASSQPEPAKEVLFSFYNGELFQIAAHYDRYEIEGLTSEDLIAAISATYGPATKPTTAVKVSPDSYGDQEEVLAQWQDSQFRFDLIRASYGPAYKLVGVMKRLEAPAEAANLEAKRLDDLEAPQRDAARLASEEEASKAKLEKARLVNKPRFRP